LQSGWYRAAIRSHVAAPADLILHNGRITTQNDRRSLAEAAAIGTVGPLQHQDYGTLSGLKCFLIIPSSKNLKLFERR